MKSQWSEEATSALNTPVDELVYASRLIGLEPELVVWGGGNSSVKAPARDFRGRELTALYIKASGSDMRTLTAKNIAALDLEPLLALKTHKKLSDEDMVAYLGHCMLHPGGPRPSIETLLHAFIPAKHVYHVHSDAIVALTNTPDGPKHVAAALGRDMPIVPYVRPGFDLSLKAAQALARHPAATALVLDHHGLITWAGTAREAYERTISLVDKAERYLRRHAKSPKTARQSAVSVTEHRQKALEVLPLLRGLLGPEAGVLSLDESPATLARLNRPDLAKLAAGGPATPDHLLHTRPWPLVVDVQKIRAEDLEAVFQKALADWAKRYGAYTKGHAPRGSVLFPPVPRVLFLPGLGLVGVGKNKKTAGMTRDIALRWLNVMTQSAGLGGFKSISPRDMGDFEYWPMENFKLTLAPQEKPFSRQVVLVGGAAGAIGKAVSQAFFAQGAHLALVDLNGRDVCQLARELNDAAGEERTICLGADLTKEKDVLRVVEETVLRFGGLDGVVFNAGIARCAPLKDTSLEDWETVMRTNATGHFVLARETLKVLSKQGRGGWLVFIGSKNVYGPGKDFGAYSASKAALTQLARVLAVEAAEEGVRVNIVSPDGVFTGSGLWSDDLRKNRAQSYKIPEKELEDFYRQRNLLKRKVSPQDVAEAVVFLASSKAAATTGAVIPVDGGVKEAFPR